MVLRQGMTLAAIGLVAGLAGALALARGLGGFLYGVEPHDPLTLAGIAVVLLAVSAAACALPARRATMVDPVGVLNAESSRQACRASGCGPAVAMATRR